MDLIATVIVNYKNEYQTINYINQELKKKYFQNIIIIVNNSSTLDSNNLLCENLNAELIYDIDNINSRNTIFVINSIENLGFANANNLGTMFIVKNFKHIEYILFTNTDIIIIDENVIEFLISKLESNSDIGMIGPNCLDSNGISRVLDHLLLFKSKYLYANIATLFFIKKNKNKNI